MSDYDDECTMVKTLDRERLASLWQDTAFNDVILVVEGPQTTLKIPAHKAVLAESLSLRRKNRTSMSPRSSSV